MIHDLELLDKLSVFPPMAFDGEVFRATRRSLDALTTSTSGGRWAPKNSVPALYTSCERAGALAELVFHWSQYTPLPTKPAAVHRIRLTTKKTFRFLRADLTELGVNWDLYSEASFTRTQEIGAAVAFLECDGLIAPSARWDCENLVLFTDNHGVANDLEVLATEEVDWVGWAREHKLLPESDQPVR
ncbi:MAG: RES family NAD+ phosphorylase [Gammaproteobacteria bacterium]